MRMANKSALFEVYVHAFSITHATIQLPIYPADPPLLTTGSTDCLRHVHAPNHCANERHLT